MKTTKHIIGLQNGWVLLPNDNKPNGLAATIQYELMQAGYMLDEKAYNAVEYAPHDEAVCFHSEVIGYLRTMLGDTGNFRPFYEGFPQQVMELSHAELFINQLLHYWSNGAFEPDAWKGERPVAMEHPQYKMLHCGTTEDFEAIFTTLCAANQAHTDQSRATILWFVRNYPDVARLLPPQVPFKETLCMLAAEGMPVTLATATDVLRLAVYMSGGDISLPPIPSPEERKKAKYKTHTYKFKKFTRSERRMLIERLEQSTCDASEMALKAERWKRLGEILHIGDYARRYPRSVQAINSVRNDQACSWYAQVAAADSIKEKIDILSQRPGEYVRRLDLLLRQAGNESDRGVVIDTFAQLLPNVSSKVLYELYNHFLRRSDPDAVRPLQLKNRRTPIFLDALPPMNSTDIERLNTLIADELKRRYSTLPPMGRVYIDDKLRNIPVPLQMRGLNPTLKTLVRGTRVPLGNANAKVIRFYLHWIDKEYSEDLDLSATFVGEESIETISWATGLKNQCAIHSGDVRHRKGDCAEYIDVILDEARKTFRYVIITANNFERRPMNSIDAAFGYMEREHPEANRTWIPQTTANSFRFSSEAQGVHMVIFDLEQMQYIVLDTDSQSLPVAALDTPLMLRLIHLYTQTPALDMYTLLSWHATTRGTLVHTPDEADTILNYENFTTQYTECLKYKV